MLAVPLALVMLVTAYHKTTPMATGERPRAGVCAGPRAYLRHHVVIAGRRYRVADVSRSGGFDVWLPTRKQCRRWGRKRLHVRVIHPRSRPMKAPRQHHRRRR